MLDIALFTESKSIGESFSGNLSRSAGWRWNEAMRKAPRGVIPMPWKFSAEVIDATRLSDAIPGGILKSQVGFAVHGHVKPFETRLISIGESSDENPKNISLYIPNSKGAPHQGEIAIVSGADGRPDFKRPPYLYFVDTTPISTSGLKQIDYWDPIPINPIVISDGGIQYPPGENSLIKLNGINLLFVAPQQSEAQLPSVLNSKEPILFIIPIETGAY